MDLDICSKCLYFMFKRLCVSLTLQLTRCVVALYKCVQATGHCSALWLIHKQQHLLSKGGRGPVTRDSMIWFATELSKPELEESGSGSFRMLGKLALLCVGSSDWRSAQSHKTCWIKRRNESSDFTQRVTTETHITFNEKNDDKTAFYTTKGQWLNRV